MGEEINLQLDAGDAEYIAKNKYHAKISILTELAAACFKIAIGLLILSFVWFYSGIYTIFGAVSKGIFFGGIRKREKTLWQLNHALCISVILIISAVAFDVCSMLKNIGNTTIIRLPIWVVALLCALIFGSYILYITRLVQTRKRKEVIFFAYRIIDVSGALMNMVLLQTMIVSCTNLSDSIIHTINSIFGYFIGATLVLIAILLFIACIQEKKIYKRTKAKQLS